MTELKADIQRADYAQAMSQQTPVPDMFNIAYLSNVASSAVYVRAVPSRPKLSLGLGSARTNESK
jgi:hypothetical protein